MASSSNMADLVEMDSESSKSSEDEFVEAPEAKETSGQAGLGSAMEEANLAIHHFFNNKYKEAQTLMETGANSSMYHAEGKSVFSFLAAVLTFEKSAMRTAMKNIKHCVSMCSNLRRNPSLTESVGTILGKRNHALFTDLEAHAELCYAESLLLHAIITFIEDEDLSALIKGTLKIRNCYNSYKDCKLILEKKRWEDKESQSHFASGVYMGMGSFNLLISLLPSRVITLLEFVGFKGDMNVGLEELKRGAQTAGLRQPLCVMALLGYHLILSHFLGRDTNLTFCSEMIDQELLRYPDGVWFLFFKGRLEFLKGNLTNSVDWYQRSIESQDVWKPFHHICYWDLLWVNCIQMNWRQAIVYCVKLLDESNWSRTIYCYENAAIMLQLADNLTQTESKIASSHFKKASLYKQRFAGKSLPMEKFVIRRCERFREQGNKLLCPAIEMMCLWNMFEIFKNNSDVAIELLKLLENEQRLMEETNVWKNEFEFDNLALLLYMKACCLRNMDIPRQALKNLEMLMSLKDKIKEDKFLLPYGLAEMGYCYRALGDSRQAMAVLREAKKKFHGYSLESRLHFRIHSALQALKAEEREK